MNKLSLIGMIFGAVFAIFNFLRYWYGIGFGFAFAVPDFSDPDKAIAYVVIGISFSLIFYIYDRLKLIEEKIEEINKYLEKNWLLKEK